MSVAKTLKTDALTFLGRSQCEVVAKYLAQIEHCRV